MLNERHGPGMGLKKNKPGTLALLQKVYKTAAYLLCTWRRLVAVSGALNGINHPCVLSDKFLFNICTQGITRK